LPCAMFTRYCKPEISRVGSTRIADEAGINLLPDQLLRQPARLRRSLWNHCYDRTWSVGREKIRLLQFVPEDLNILSQTAGQRPIRSQDAHGLQGGVNQRQRRRRVAAE